MWRVNVAGEVYILKDHDACLKGDGTGCPHALAWVFWSHEDGEMHRIG